jgi:hypothetical protein
MILILTSRARQGKQGKGTRRLFRRRKELGARLQTGVMAVIRSEGRVSVLVLPGVSVSGRAERWRSCFIRARNRRPGWPGNKSIVTFLKRGNNGRGEEQSSEQTYTSLKLFFLCVMDLRCRVGGSGAPKIASCQMVGLREGGRRNRASPAVRETFAVDAI